MNKEDMYAISFQLILHSGNARSFAMEAMQMARKGYFEEAALKLKEAETELSLTNRFQTELIQNEEDGNQFDIPLILIHAQDHLMTAMTLKDIAIEIVDLRQLRAKALV